jgi:hypothetical protein
MDDLPAGVVGEINQFWLSYNHLRGRTFEVLALGDAARGASLVKAASQAPQAERLLI